MKVTKLLQILFLTISINTYSQDKSLSKEEFNTIREELCKDVVISNTSGFNINRFSQIILKGLHLKSNLSNTNEIVSNFLNTYKNKLVCMGNSASNTSRDLLLYKMALLDGVIDLFDEILIDEDNYNIDFNAYQIYKGKKETLLNFIDLLIKGGDDGNDELESIREVLVHLGAKHGKDLK